MRFFVLVLLGFLWALPVSASEDDPVLFKVASEAYRLSDFRQFVLKRPHYQHKLLNRVGVDELLREYIDAQVFRLEGLRLGVEPPHERTDRDDAYYFTVQMQTIPRCPVIADEAAKAFYRNHPHRFSTPAFVRVSRVVLAEEDSIDGVPASAFLQRAAEAQDETAAAFERLVTQVTVFHQSQGREVTGMGDLGFLQIATDPAALSTLDRQLLASSTGSLIGPFADAGRVFLLRVSDRREPVLTSWPEAMSEARRAAAADCAARMLDEKRAELDERFNLVRNEDAIRQLEPVRTPAMQ